MSNTQRNYYKMCRETASFSQEYAAGLLSVSPRTLSDYENDKANVPDDVVYKMCEIYDTRQLAMWHLKNKSPLGEFLPEVYEPTSVGDMVFSLAIAMDTSAEAYTAISTVMRDRKLQEEELPVFLEAIKKAKEANSNLTSIIIFAENMAKKQFSPLRD